MSPESLFAQLKSIDQPPSEDIFRQIETQKNEVIPLLLKELDEIANNLDIIETRGHDYIRHVISPFILAYFRSKEAYPKLIKFISHSGDKLVKLTGEVFTEALGRILASVYDGNIQPIKSVIENPVLSPWVRSAALESMVVLWKEEVLTRQEIVQYLNELMNNKLERVPSYIWDNIGLIAYDLHPFGMEELLRQAIDDRLIAPLVMDGKLLEDCLKSDMKIVVSHKNKVIKGYIQSPIEELTWWLYPNQNELNKGLDYANVEVPIADKKIIPGERSAPMGWRPQTVLRSVPKIGRNEPCYCGSGKKFKKCCGASQ